MKYIVDRFEEAYVVLENMETKDMVEVVNDCLPFPIHEGDVLYFDGNEYSFDEAETIKRRNYIIDRFNRLKNNSSDWAVIYFF